VQMGMLENFLTSGQYEFLRGMICKKWEINTVYIGWLNHRIFYHNQRFVYPMIF